MSFREALHTVMHDIFWKIALPDPVFKLPSKRLRHVQTGFDELKQYFMEMIQQRKIAGGDVRMSDTGRNDLLGALVHATADSNAEGLQEDESEKEELKKRSASLSDEEGMCVRTFACKERLCTLYRRQSWATSTSFFWQDMTQQHTLWHLL